MRYLVILPALFFIGCGGSTDDASDNPSEVQTAVVSAVTFEEEIEDAPCTVLTPELVSEVFSVPAEGIEQREIVGICSYSWEGGQASIGRISVFESVEKAQQRFEQTYRTMTPEEREQAAEAMRDGLERRREAGELTDQQAEMAEGLANTVGDLVEDTEYEPVADLGDQAVYDGTVRTTSTGMLGDFKTAESNLHLRLGNLVTTVRADLYEPGDDIEVIRAGPPPEARQQNREATVTLARAVLATLR